MFDYHDYYPCVNIIYINLNYITVDPYYTNEGCHQHIASDCLINVTSGNNTHFIIPPI